MYYLYTRYLVISVTLTVTAGLKAASSSKAFQVFENKTYVADGLLAANRLNITKENTDVRRADTQDAQNGENVKTVSGLSRANILNSKPVERKTHAANIKQNKEKEGAGQRIKKNRQNDRKTFATRKQGKVARRNLKKRKLSRTHRKFPLVKRKSSFKKKIRRTNKSANRKRIKKGRKKLNKRKKIHRKWRKRKRRVRQGSKRVKTIADVVRMMKHQNRRGKGSKIPTSRIRNIFFKKTKKACKGPKTSTKIRMKKEKILNMKKAWEKLKNIAISKRKLAQKNNNMKKIDKLRTNMIRSMILNHKKGKGLKISSKRIRRLFIKHDMRLFNNWKSKRKNVRKLNLQKNRTRFRNVPKSKRRKWNKRRRKKGSRQKNIRRKGLRRSRGKNIKRPKPAKMFDYGKNINITTTKSTKKNIYNTKMGLGSISVKRNFSEINKTDGPYFQLKIADKVSIEKTSDNDVNTASKNTDHSKGTSDRKAFHISTNNDSNTIIAGSELKANKTGMIEKNDSINRDHLISNENVAIKKSLMNKTYQRQNQSSVGNRTNEYRINLFKFKENKTNVFDEKHLSKNDIGIKAIAYKRELDSILNKVNKTSMKFHSSKEYNVKYGNNKIDNELAIAIEPASKESVFGEPELDLHKERIIEIKNNIFNEQMVVGEMNNNVTQSITNLKYDKPVKKRHNIVKSVTEDDSGHSKLRSAKVISETGSLQDASSEIVISSILDSKTDAVTNMSIDTISNNITKEQNGHIFKNVIKSNASTLSDGRSELSIKNLSRTTADSFSHVKSKNTIKVTSETSESNADTSENNENGIMQALNKTKSSVNISHTFKSANAESVSKISKGTMSKSHSKPTVTTATFERTTRVSNGASNRMETNDTIFKPESTPVFDEPLLQDLNNGNTLKTDSKVVSDDTQASITLNTTEDEEKVVQINLIKKDIIKNIGKPVEQNSSTELSNSPENTFHERSDEDMELTNRSHNNKLTDAEEPVSKTDIKRTNSDISVTTSSTLRTEPAVTKTIYTSSVTKADSTKVDSKSDEAENTLDGSNQKETTMVNHQPILKTFKTNMFQNTRVTPQSRRISVLGNRRKGFQRRRMILCDYQCHIRKRVLYRLIRDRKSRRNLYNNKSKFKHLLLRNTNKRKKVHT